MSTTAENSGQHSGDARAPSRPFVGGLLRNGNRYIVHVFTISTQKSQNQILQIFLNRHQARPPGAISPAESGAG